jgi:hypothetical protein
LMTYDILVVDENGQAWSTSAVDTNRDEEHLADGAFDESKALEALERMREEIARYQALREDVNQQFERFVQGFKKPEPLAPAAPRPQPALSPVPPPVAPPPAFTEAPAHQAVVPPPIPRATADSTVNRLEVHPEPRRPTPQPRVPPPEPTASAISTATANEPVFDEAAADRPTPEGHPPSDEARRTRLNSSEPPSVPLPPVAPDTPFEPLSLEPFARQIEGPRVERHLSVPVVDEPPALTDGALAKADLESSTDELADLDSTASEATEPISRQRVPTSPEAFAAVREDDEDPDASFAPGEAFDALPPPLQATDDSLALSPPPAPPRPAHTRTWVLLGGIVIVAAAGAYIWMPGQADEVTVVGEPAPAPAGGQAPRGRAQRPPETGQATTGTGQGAATPTQPAATLKTEIVTTEPAWVRVIADGERVIERELPANARIPFTAERTIQIRTGNAGAVRLSIRGKDQGSLGKIGEVVTRSFTVPGR